VLLLILLVLLAAAVALLIRRFIKNRRQFRERLQACLNKNNSVAVRAMFSCVMQTLRKLGLDDQGVWLAGLLALKLEDIRDLPADHFARVFAIYEEAAYSKRDPDDEKLLEVKDFLSKLSAVIKGRQSKLIQLKLRSELKLLAAIEKGV
jgi:hypothetical protein